MGRSAPPNAYPKGLHGVYRGRLVRKPRTIDRPEKSPMVVARIAVNLAAPSVPREQRDQLTEWVNVIAFSDRTRHLLSQCEKGHMIGVMGNVTLELYATRSGENAVNRTLVAEDVVSAAGSLQANVAHPADIDDGLKSAMDEASASVLPERQTLPEDGIPDLD